MALNKQPQNSVDRSFNGLQLHRKLQARTAMDEFLNTDPPSVEIPLTCTDINGKRLKTNIYRPEEKKKLVETHMHYFARGLLLAQDNAKVMAAWNQRMTSIMNETVRVPESELDVALKNLDLANRNLRSALMTLRTAAAQQDEAMTEM
tara:strand:- start:1258 stop:1701 length:444 start_codon:yes stop_codon:yes gene_type:complete